MRLQTSTITPSSSEILRLFRLLFNNHDDYHEYGLGWHKIPKLSLSALPCHVQIQVSELVLHLPPNDFSGLVSFFGARYLSNGSV